MESGSGAPEWKSNDGQLLAGESTLAAMILIGVAVFTLLPLQNSAFIF